MLIGIERVRDGFYVAAGFETVGVRYAVADRSSAGKYNFKSPSFLSHDPRFTCLTGYQQIENYDDRCQVSFTLIKQD